MIFMFPLLSLMARMRNWNRPQLRRADARGIAQNLMTNAEARAGRDPQQAVELREAARAYLRVVR